MFDKKVRLKSDHDLCGYHSTHALPTLQKDLMGFLMVQREGTDKALAKVLVPLTLLGSHWN